MSLSHHLRTVAALGLGVLGIQAAHAADEVFSTVAFDTLGDVSGFMSLGGPSGGYYSHRDTGGQRAHRRWKKARASGRHNFRAALRG